MNLIFSLPFPIRPTELRVLQRMSMLWRWEPWVRHQQEHLLMKNCRMCYTHHQDQRQLAWVVEVPWDCNTRGHGVPLRESLLIIRYSHLEVSYHSFIYFYLLQSSMKLPEHVCSNILPLSHGSTLPNCFKHMKHPLPRMLHVLKWLLNKQLNIIETMWMHV